MPFYNPDEDGLDNPANRPFDYGNFAQQLAAVQAHRGEGWGVDENLYPVEAIGMTQRPPHFDAPPVDVAVGDSSPFAGVISEEALYPFLRAVNDDIRRAAETRQAAPIFQQAALIQPLSAPLEETIEIGELARGFADILLARSDMVSRETAFSSESRFSPEEQERLIEAFHRFANDPTQEHSNHFLEALLGDSAHTINAANRQQIWSCLRHNIPKLATILCRPDGVEQLVGAIYSVSDGCVANLGSQMSLLVHQVLLSDATPEERLLYSVLTDRILVPMTHQLPQDLLTGNPRHDPIQDSYVHRFRVPAALLLQNVQEAMQPSEMAQILQGLEGHYEGLTEYLTAHDYERQGRMIAAHSTFLQAAPTVLMHPALRPFVQECETLLAASQQEQAPEAVQEGGFAARLAAEGQSPRGEGQTHAERLDQQGRGYDAHLR